MSKLPEEQRLAIALVLVEGMSYKEAAEVLEIPIGTLTSRLARGRTALAAALGDTGVNYDDETLMAYADGELDEAQRAEIAAAIEQDPELARRVQRHRALARRGRGRFRHGARSAASRTPGAAARAAPNPRGRRAAPRWCSFPARTAPPAARQWGGRQWAAMAASLVLGVFISWQLFAPPEPLMTASQGALVARGALASALDQQRASTQRESDPVQIGVTFRTQDGRYCRSFALRAAGTAGLACHVDGEWQIPVTAAARRVRRRRASGRVAAPRGIAGDRSANLRRSSRCGGRGTMPSEAAGMPGAG